MIKAISPDEALNQRALEFPPEVIEAVNELLRQRWTGKGSVHFKQDEVMALALKNFAEAGKKITRQEIYDRNWLDFEPIFEKEGWKVVYDKPAYCESYDPNFTFSRK